MPSLPRADDFPSTQWSLIARAGGNEPNAQAALAVLCEQYWYPVYSFFRRRAASVDVAEDLTQGFFAHLLDGGMVARADESQGRFRSYLIGCCQNYLVDHLRREGAQKRGGKFAGCRSTLLRRKPGFAKSRPRPTTRSGNSCGTGHSR